MAAGIHCITRRASLAKVVALAGGAVCASAAQRRGQPYALVAGTVFQENGLSFPGVDVTLQAKNTGGGRQNARTSNRGEFTFRVPPAPGVYVVAASRKGFRTATVDADVPGEGRVDVTITLAPESKK